MDEITDILRIYIFDMDGNICENIPNEHPERFYYARPMVGAKEVINELYEKGNIIVVWTARPEGRVTKEWFKRYGIKIHGLFFNKPRITKTHREYVFVDNNPVRGITNKDGKWNKFSIKNAKVMILE